MNAISGPAESWKMEMDEGSSCECRRIKTAMSLHSAGIAQGEHTLKRFANGKMTVFAKRWVAS